MWSGSSAGVYMMLHLLGVVDGLASVTKGESSAEVVRSGAGAKGIAGILRFLRKLRDVLRVARCRRIRSYLWFAS